MLFIMIDDLDKKINLSGNPSATRISAQGWYLLNDSKLLIDNDDAIHLN